MDTTGLTYEVWILGYDGSWGRARDADTKLDLYGDKKQALAVAGKVASREDTKQVVVIERRAIFTLNGSPKPKAKRVEVGGGEETSGENGEG